MKLPSNETERSNSEVSGTANGSNSEESNSVPDTVHNAMIQGAIDAVFRSHEQTYEQFLRSFSHLTVADIARSHAREVSEELVSLASALSPHATTSDPTKRDETDGTVSGVVSSEDVNQPTFPTDSKHESDDLPEEVLTEGTVVVDPLLRSNEGVGVSSVKVDNFVSFENIDEDGVDDETESSYQASFLPGNRDENRCKVQEENSTLEWRKPERFASFGAQLDEPGAKNQSSPTADSPDGDETGNNVDTESRIVKYDLAQNAKKWENYVKQISDSEDENLTYDPSLDGVNPGEVDDSDVGHPRPVDHETRLDFTECHSSDKPLAQQESKHKEDTSGANASSTIDVEEFKLDDDFDYDNVVLTPKYSAAEMALLADMLKGNVTPVRVPFAASFNPDTQSSEDEDSTSVGHL